jgi:hypothetical protein
VSLEVVDLRKVDSIAVIVYPSSSKRNDMVILDAFSLPRFPQFKANMEVTFDPMQVGDVGVWVGGLEGMECITISDEVVTICKLCK